MYRLLALSGVGLAFGSLCELLSQSEPVLLPMQRFFSARPSPSLPSMLVLRAHFSPEGLYFVSSNGSHQIGFHHGPLNFARLGSQGTHDFSRALPQAGAVDMLRLESGNLLVQLVNPGGSTFHEFDQRGEVVRTFTADKPYSLYAVIGGFWLRVNDRDEVEKGSYPPTPGEIPMVLGHIGLSPHRLVQPLKGRALLIDRVDGRCLKVDLKSGLSATARINSQDLDSAVDAYAAIQHNAPAGSRVAQGLAVTSSAADEQGNVYLALSPYSVAGGATVLQIGPDFAVRRSFRCQIAWGTDATKAITPSYLGVNGQELFFVSSNGDVGVFLLPR